MYKLSKEEREYIKSIGVRISKARKSLNMTQQELADAAQLDRSGLSMVETGRNACNVVTLKRISLILKIEVRDFFDYI